MKMAMLLKATYIFTTVPHQNLNYIFHRDRKINPKVHMKVQKTSDSQNNPEQKEQH
jgi:hypothetical protein